jgi:sigma-B regulation protein RsbU (phosphoserine phosphatase)
MQILNCSLARRMTALIVFGAGLVMLAVLAFAYVSQRRQLLASDRAAGQVLAQSVATQIELALGRAEATVRQTAVLLADQPLSRATSAGLIRRTLTANPELFGMAVALTPPAAAAGDFQILYGWRDGTGLQVLDRPTPAQDYQSDWFRLPVERAAPVWIEPYFDAQAQTTMVTFAAPVQRQGTVVAVVTCDLSLADIRALLAGLALGQDGTAILLSSQGTFIAHPSRPQLEMKETIFSLAQSSPDPEDGRTLTELGQQMLAGQHGHRRYRRPYADDRRVAHMFYAPVRGAGWALGLIWTEEQVLAPLRRLNWISAAMAGLGLALLLAPALLIARSVTGPLQRLAGAAQQVATGNFAAPLPTPRAGDEIARLTAAFDHMRQDLQHYIADLTATTAAKERIAGELAVARDIQLSIVPKLFPPFPTRPDVDLYAMLIPALEVGGDLYDFALLDDDHLYLAIGDVSGKGVPASLLMAVGKTLLRSSIQSLRDPARALGHVNVELAEDNDSCMFITMFCAVLNLRTGDLIYANAGHNPPLLARLAGGRESVAEPPGPVLGVAPAAIYVNYSRRLQPGDLLLLYTDGVTEAMNPAGAMFGDQGLEDYLERECRCGTRAFLDGLGRVIRAHAAGAPQSDDITALAVRHLAPAGPAAETTVAVVADAAPPPDATLELRNHLDELPRLAAWVEATGALLALSADLRMKLNLVLEEWVVNVVSYAYTDAAAHRIAVRLWRVGDQLQIEIEDDGRPFDPTAQAAADTSLAIEHRAIGGLGIHFIRQTVDTFGYRRESGRNVVTLTKGLAATDA